jgi:hypothetical protein
MPDVETAAETARIWVSWGQAAGLGEPCTQLLSADWTILLPQPHAAAAAAADHVQVAAAQQLTIQGMKSNKHYAVCVQLLQSQEQQQWEQRSHLEL